MSWCDSPFASAVVDLFDNLIPQSMVEIDFACSTVTPPFHASTHRSPDIVEVQPYYCDIVTS